MHSAVSGEKRCTKIRIMEMLEDRTGAVGAEEQFENELSKND